MSGIGSGSGGEGLARSSQGRARGARDAAAKSVSGSGAEGLARSSQGRAQVPETRQPRASAEARVSHAHRKGAPRCPRRGSQERQRQRRRGSRTLIARTRPNAREAAAKSGRQRQRQRQRQRRRGSCTLIARARPGARDAAAISGSRRRDCRTRMAAMSGAMEQVRWGQRTSVRPGRDPGAPTICRGNGSAWTHAAGTQASGWC